MTENGVDCVQQDFDHVDHLEALEIWVANTIQ